MQCEPHVIFFISFHSFQTSEFLFKAVCNHSSEELGSSKRLKDDKGINGKKLTYVEALQVNKVERMVLVEIIYGGLPIHSCRE